MFSKSIGYSERLQNSLSSPAAPGSKRDAAPSRFGPVGDAVRRCSRIFFGVGVFSGVINVLALTGSLYMLQVYDRVIPSRSVETLIGLSVLMAGLFVANGLLDFFRVRLMSRIGVQIDRDLRSKVFSAVQALSLRLRPGGDGLQPVRDLDQIRNFLSGLGPTAFFDVPWIPLYLVVVFLLHPWLGIFALLGAILLVGLTILTDIKSSAPMKAAAVSGGKRLAFGELSRRNAEVIRAMGIGRRMETRWTNINKQFLEDQLKASDAAGGIGTVTKVLRMLLQSGILGLGAYLVIRGEVSPGTIIAASITMSRSLAPIEVAIAHWRGFVSARQSYHRLTEMFSALAQQEGEVLALPKPEKSVTVQSLTVAPPGETKPVLLNVSFALQSGDGLGVIGPSACGKSTLARAMVGAWQPLRQGGSVRLDGASLDQWSPEALGWHVGYLPQDIELFDGTIAENISRYDENATSEAIVAAARAAGVHDMIVHLPKGYQMDIGEGGRLLSAGQRQRIALARALYKDPFMVVLDEPNSNLDLLGDQALTDAIRSVRRRGGIVIVIAHRPSALAGVDKVLALSNGQVHQFGPRDEVLRKIFGQPPNSQAQPPKSETPGLKVIAERPAQPPPIEKSEPKAGDQPAEPTGNP